MSDRELIGNDDLSLPKATVSKIISEILQPGESFTREARDVLIDCCVEFVSMLSSEANDIMEKESKKTMGVEHIAEALKGLGFPEYVKEVVAAVDEHKGQLRNREKRTTKLEQSGMSQEELLAQQQELFKSATDKYNQGPA